MRKLLLLIIVLSTASVGYGRSPGKWLGKATAEYANRNYTLAIKYFRRHLRQYPGDDSTWNYLAASYLFSGQARKGLGYLRRMSMRTRLKSFNQYHQALCYEVLNKPEKAIRALKKASQLRAIGAQGPFSLTLLLERHRIRRILESSRMI